MLQSKDVRRAEIHDAVKLGVLLGSVSIPLYRLLPLSDIRRLPTYSGALGPRRPSLKSRVEILMKSEAFTDRDRAERISTQIFGLSLTVVFVGMLLLNAISY